MMRVAMYYSNTDIRLKEMPKPLIGNGEILMRVERSGICGSDVMEWYRIHKVPLVLGHEVAGIVEEVGKGVRMFQVGDRIVATHHVPCLQCEYCLNGHETVCETLRQTHFEPGGFAEYIRLPAINVQYGTLHLPQDVSFEEGTFVEPLGCVLRGQRLIGMKQGWRVVVIGSGISGLLHIQMAKFYGVKSLITTDINPFRLAMARKMGADFALEAREDVPQKVKEIWEGRLAQAVIICAGNQSAIRQGLLCVDRGGVVLIFSACQKDAYLPISTNDIFWRNEVTLMSSYAASPSDLKEALGLIGTQNIQVSDLITHRLPLEETQRGFQLVTHPQNSLKVMIEPQGRSQPSLQGKEQTTRKT